ncbi:methylated-DNA--protein-cysteine methyltransferase [Caldalkalibacillus thermarum]|uniref:methylated-DNA--[protein]-cysteine S-methyltransferase n=1 Tax=Caldalkalibacillus thermarum TaxID=296745 RepID=UPI0016659017|nr:methylated-DNA--[protein]-cysteine S-methyltransferase [Caldalkalibacillus thermarum]GGK31764.1 methylated-DNA--protein-cysteine methyltransferase [Caldalkalibacillus thermarum]
MSTTFNIYYAELETPVGMLTLARTTKGLCTIDFGRGENTLATLAAWARKHFLFDRLVHDQEALREEQEQLHEYFTGNRTRFQCELHLVGTPFQKRVWQALLTIPYGEVRSYKEIAQQIGTPQAVRAVGGANNKNPVPIIVPCHRVIGSNGTLVGYGGGLEIKRQLLLLEQAPLNLEANSV